MGNDIGHCKSRSLISSLGEDDLRLKHGKGQKVITHGWLSHQLRSVMIHQQGVLRQCPGAPSQWPAHDCASDHVTINVDVLYAYTVPLT